jgi:uncharacterized protein with NAD-binding domain and iron-sulfur cluster
MNGANVTIVGGGLAGMVAAWRLLERGCNVSIFEASGRWGGKAGATQSGGTFEEHGYHIFPAWYQNVRRLVDELGLRDSFRDCTEFKQLRAGAYPDFRTFTNITSARYVWSNLTAGVIPFAETFLFFYAALDLMSQPYRYRAQLDQVTVTGFLRSRFYRTERIAQQFQELMLKGISVPTYEVSAMTMRNVMRFWVKSPETHASHPEGRSSITLDRADPHQNRQSRSITASRATPRSHRYGQRKGATPALCRWRGKRGRTSR